MMTRATALILFAVCHLLRAESVLPENLKSGKLIPGSTSPDGVYCLLEVFHSDTTQNSVIIATTDRMRNLGFADVFTEWSTDAPHKGRTTVVWHTDSKRFVVHDSYPKNSKAEIYRLTENGFERLTTHDLLSAACGHFGIRADSVASSGQLPLKWHGDLVDIEVAVRQKSGQRLRHPFAIHAPLQGPSIQQ